jgi:fumarate reductase flavoprotein subunit
VVVGAGLAGWIAAVEAQKPGATVVVIDRSDRLPGTGNSIASGGVLHACLQDPRGDPDALFGRLMDLTDKQADEGVARAWADNAAAAVQWIEDHGGELGTEPGPALYARVFQPRRETVPGLNGAGCGLDMFLAGLARRYLAAGGTLLQPARATSLSRHGSKWRVSVEDSPDVEADCVVLADGGFQADPQLVKRYIGTDRYKLRATSFGAGDGLRMGLSAGGVAVNMQAFYGHLLCRDALSNDRLWPYPILDGLCAVGALVGSDGRRFTDEGQGGVAATNNVAWSPDPLGTWVVFDDVAWQGIGRQGTTPPNPHLEDHGGTVFSAGTLEELAASAGIPPAALGRTIEELSAGGARPPRTGRVSIIAPPLHAVPVVAGVTFTMGGLLVDEHARVVDETREPIDGLYAAGGTMGGLHGGPRAGYAGGLLEAAVFGLLAGRHIAEREGLGSP